MWEKGFPQIRKQYRFEEDNNAYLIEVSLDDYNDVYDDWDPAPFKKRFIEEEFNYFIVTSSEDIPLKYDVNIVLYIPEKKKDIKKEKAVLSAYKNYYSYALEKIKSNCIKLRSKNIFYFLLSLTFICIGYLLQYGTKNVFLDIIKQGIGIGSWVFLWEVFTNIFIKKREIRTKYKIIKRLCLSDIKFVYF